MTQKKLYDTLLLPTGETTAGDETSFPVSRKAIELYNEGRFGSIFITGGHGGFATLTPETLTEAEVTRNFMLEQGVPEKAIYWDGQSLDTIGNFTFPIYQQEGRNPNLLQDFESILMLGQVGHMWRAKEYSALMPFEKYTKTFDIETIPGEHNNGKLTRFYHDAVMKKLTSPKIELPDDIHKFLLEEHPFYSQGWFEKPELKRKLEAMAKTIGWAITG